MRTFAGRLTLLMLGLLWLATARAAADDQPATAARRTTCPICSHANMQDGNYAATSGTTFVRGASNALLGWTEIIRRPAEEARAGGNVVVGMGKGLGQGVVRTVTGLGEVLTFWVPKTKAYPVNIAQDCPLCMGRRSVSQHPAAQAAAPNATPSH